MHRLAECMRKAIGQRRTSMCLNNMCTRVGCNTPNARVLAHASLFPEQLCRMELEHWNAALRHPSKIPADFFQCPQFAKVLLFVTPTGFQQVQSSCVRASQGTVGLKVLQACLRLVFHLPPTPSPKNVSEAQSGTMTTMPYIHKLKRMLSQICARYVER